MPVGIPFKSKFCGDFVSPVAKVRATLPVLVSASGRAVSVALTFGDYIGAHHSQLAQGRELVLGAIQYVSQGSFQQRKSPAASWA